MCSVSNAFLHLTILARIHSTGAFQMNGTEAYRQLQETSQ